MDKKKSFLFTIIFLSQSAYQIWGDECDFMGPTGLYCVVNNKLYDNGNLMYAFDQSVVAVNAILPSNNRVTALATATCRRLFVDDREEYCVPKSCTVPICLFQFVDPEPAERIIIEVVSNIDQCQQVNFNFYFKAISPIPSFYAIENNDVPFGWTFPFELVDVKWFKGDKDGDLIMTYTPANDHTNIEDGYIVNYIKATKSVGMVLLNTTEEASGNYTVLVNITNNILDYTTTSLTMITASAYEEFKERASITINEGSVISYGQLIQATDSGDIDIKTIVPSDYGEVTTTICTRTSPNGEDVNCGNCTTLTCQFTVRDTVPREMITVNIKIVNLQASPFQFTAYIKGISPLANITTVEGFDLIIPWQYPFPFKRVQWFSGGIDGTLMMTYINESNQIVISNGFEINYDNADGSIGMLVPNVMVNCSIFAVKVIITDLAFEDSSVGVTVIPSSVYDVYKSNTNLTVNAVKQISYGDSIEVLDPGDFNCSIMIPNDYGETNATCIHLKLDGSSSSCGSCTVTGCQFEVTDAGIAERITINIQIDGISGSLFSFVLVVRGISQINEIMALSGCDVIIPWTYRMSFVKVEWFAGNDTTGKNMMTYLPDSGKVEVFPLYSVKFYNVTDSIGMILPNTTTNSAYTVKVTVNSFTTEDTTTSVILQEATSYKQIFKVTVNSNMDIKYSDENVNIIEGGMVEMNVNTKGLPNARTTCTQTPLSGNATTCNNCAEDSACHYNVTEARPADKITVSTEVIGLQCSFLELDIIVTSFTPIASFFAIENNNVSFEWTFPFEIREVKWLKGEKDGAVMMTYTPGNDNTTIDQGYQVEYINTTNSVGMILLNAGTDASNTYTVLVNMADQRQDYSMTTLTMITTTDYESFIKRATIKINEDSPISYGQGIEAVDCGELIINTVVPNDYGENTTTACTRTSSKGENVKCGNCSGLDCHFTVNVTNPAELITVNIVINTLQGSLIEFGVFTKGISPIDKIDAVEDCEVSIPWRYPSPFKKVEWLFYNGGERLISTYIPDTNEFNATAMFSNYVTLITTTDSVGIVVSLIPVMNLISFSVLVTITDFATEKATVNIHKVKGNKFKESFSGPTTLAINDTTINYGDNIDVLNPGELRLNVSLSTALWNTTNTTCNLVTSTNRMTSCGYCSDKQCAFSVTVELADRVTISVIFDGLQCGEFYFILAAKGITQLDEVTTLEGCTTIFEWTYPAEYEQVEWFDGTNSSQTLMMSYTPGIDNLTIKEDYNVMYKRSKDSIGMVIKDARQEGNYCVKVTVNEKTSEESTTKLVVVKSDDLEGYKNTITITVNGGKMIHYGDAIEDVDAGTVDIDVSVPATYGNAVISCSRVTGSNKEVACGKVVGTSHSFTVSSVKGKDHIKIEIQIPVQCAAAVDFNIKVKETKKSAAANKEDLLLMNLILITLTAFITI